MFRPGSVAELQQHLASSNAGGVKLNAVDLSVLCRVLEHTPEDMTVTVETGITLAALQSHLARHGQWLPIDPPNADTVTVTDILNWNLSGPRRFGYGTIREHLLGLKAVLPNGQVIKSGGNVVKNVAGYDLCKLFVGSQATLGVAVEATFKVQPLPAAEQFVAAHCDPLPRAASLIETVLQAGLTPAVLDLHNLDTHYKSTSTTVLVGFAGTREEVQWQIALAAKLGVTETAGLDYERRFWSDNATGPVRRLSALASRLVEAIEGVKAVQFVARAGNGMVYYRGGNEPPKTELPSKLMQRLKDTYDPNHILPAIKW